MSLLEQAFEKCVFITTERVPDGMGGYYTTYKNGAEFSAAITYNNSLTAQIAQKQGVTALYTITTAQGVNLEFHEIFKRLSDDKIFRVTANAADNKTPTAASWKYEQTTAEEWSLKS